VVLVSGNKMDQSRQYLVCEFFKTVDVIRTNDMWSVWVSHRKLVLFVVVD